MVYPIHLAKAKGVQHIPLYTLHYSTGTVGFPNISPENHVIKLYKGYVGKVMCIQRSWTLKDVLVLYISGEYTVTNKCKFRFSLVWLFRSINFRDVAPYCLIEVYLCFQGTVFWNAMPCRLVDTYQHFRGTCSLHFQVQKTLFYPKNGGSRFLCNIGIHPPICTVQHPRVL
jgi:hypothetical protein